MTNIPTPDPPVFCFHVVRYTSSLLRDEWVNIGILIFSPWSGDLRLRLIEGQDEFFRVRKLHPGADEEAIRQLRDHLEQRFSDFLQAERQEKGAGVQPGEALQRLVDKWNATLSNGIQLGPARGDYGEDIDLELDRVYREQVAPVRLERPALGSRMSMRDYCAQVWKQAGLWNRIEKSVRAEEYTFPGDPTRIDFAYRKDALRGFVHTLSVSRSPRDCKDYAHTVKFIANRIPSEFTAVTDIELNRDNARQSFVLDTLNDAGVVPVALAHFATWVPRLKAQLHL